MGGKSDDFPMLAESCVRACVICSDILACLCEGDLTHFRVFKRRAQCVVGNTG